MREAQIYIKKLLKTEKITLSRLNFFRIFIPYPVCPNVASFSRPNVSLN